MTLDLTLDELPTPSLVLDLAVLKRNLDRMAERTRRLGVALRPHVKTHKCPHVAEMQIERGASGLTVSTLREATAFAAAGFTDLTWAFPLILNRIPELESAAGDATLRLVVDSAEAVDALEGWLAGRGRGAHVWLKVDCGYHRAGVDPSSDHAVELARRIAASSTLTFDGVLTHGGQSYDGRCRADLERAAEEERRVTVQFAERLRGAGVEVRGVSVGSTPTLSVATDLTGVSEARPGNYVFHDAMQCGFGACEVRDCALTVLASVVSCQPGARHSVIDAGALSLSKETLGDGEALSYGRLFDDLAGGELAGAELDRAARLTSLSQEHGIVDRPLPVGKRVRVLMNHSCLAVPNFSHYEVIDGGRVIDRWPIER